MKSSQNCRTCCFWCAKRSDAALLQTEAFYNFADENGLLIWQDAMFGGSHYPRTAEWLNNYAEEISQQVRACPYVCVCVSGFVRTWKPAAWR